MTKFLLTSILILISISILKAQGLQASTYIERTVVGPKVGTAIGYSFSDLIEVGGFYQRATEMAEAEAGRPLREENEFYGAYFGYPLLSAQKSVIKLNVRTGVSNGENFVITPSLMGSYSPMQLVKIGGGIGVRAFKPTVMASLTLRLINRSEQ